MCRFVDNGLRQKVGIASACLGTDKDTELARMSSSVGLFMGRTPSQAPKPFDSSGLAKTKNNQSANCAAVTVQRLSLDSSDGVALA